MNFTASPGLITSLDVPDTVPVLVLPEVTTQPAAFTALITSSTVDTPSFDALFNLPFASAVVVLNAP